MAKNFSLQEVINYLESIEFLIAEGYGPGFPIYFEKGIYAIDKFCQLFITTIKQQNLDFTLLDTTQMISKQKFNQLYQAIHDYQHELISYQNNVFVSDPLCQTLPHLKQGYQNILTVSSIVRNKDKGLLPLFKERYIFPVVQFDQSINQQNKIINQQRLIKLFHQYYASLGLTIANLEAYEVTNYATSELYFITALDKKLTKTGMIYELSKQFNKNFEVPLSYELVNSGFSGKTLLLSIKNFSESYGCLAIPPQLCHILIYIAVQNLEDKLWLVNKLKAYTGAYKILVQDKKSFKKWRQSEAFYYIFVDRHAYYLYEKNENYQLFKDIHTLLSFIPQHIQILIERAKLYCEQRLTNNLKNKIQPYCSECWQGNYYGYIQTTNKRKCKSCGRSIDKLIFIENKRFY